MNLLIKIFGGSYDDLWKAIIRPNKDDYTLEELGPYKFELKGKCYKRTDFELRNKRSLKLMCSFWEPFDEEREKPRLPCIIYLHGNSSSRCEAYPEVKYLLQRNITVFSFDFCGCGKSEGEYISLGYYEKRDVHCVVEYLLKSKKVSKIGLWGRSMGAVTAIMYANEHPQLIDVMILDSGFYSLKILIKELIDSKINLPKFIYDRVLNMVKETVKEKAKFDLDIIEPYIYAKNCLVPAFFCHGSDDNFVFPHHCVDLFNEYKGKDKCCEIVKGSHNTSRPKELRIKICEYLLKYLKDDDLESIGTINNSNTYERVDINYNIFKIIKNNNIGQDKDFNLAHSMNYLELKPINVKKCMQNKKQIKNNFNGFLNEINIDEIANDKNYNINASQNMRTYSHNKYSKNNLNLINKKNTTFNIKNNKLKLKKPNENKDEENISSSSSSSDKDKKPKIYQKKNIQKEPFNSIKIKTFPISQYFSDINKIIKNNINKTPLVNNRNNNVINMNNNKSVIKINNNNNNNNNFSHSFLKTVIKNAQNCRNHKNITISNSFFKNNNISKSSYLKSNKNINNDDKNMNDKFFIENSNNNTNIIQNNYFTTNNIYLGKYVGNKHKKNEQKVNFSYTSKKPDDKYNFKIKDKGKNLHKNEIKKNLLKSFDIKRGHISNLLNNRNYKNLKIISKSSIHSTENTNLDENEETIGRNLPH